VPSCAAKLVVGSRTQIDISGAATLAAPGAKCHWFQAQL
jgi:hypothetical protein